MPRFTYLEAENYLESKIWELSNDKLKKCYMTVLLSDMFRFWPGSVDKHHSVIGGLLIHSAEVIEIALSMAKSKTLSINTERIICAGIFHDYAKIFDYKLSVHNRGLYLGKSSGEIEKMRADPNLLVKDLWEKCDYRFLIRHVCGSYAEWIKAAEEAGVNEEDKMHIGHIILGHHGRQEWGSPVLPQTVEAYVLHYADMLSADF